MMDAIQLTSRNLPRQKFLNIFKIDSNESPEQDKFQKKNEHKHPLKYGNIPSQRDIKYQPQGYKLCMIFIPAAGTQSTIPIAK